MLPEQLDTLKCQKLLELKEALKQKYIHKDNLLLLKREKENELIPKSLTDSRIDRELRRDKDLFALRRLVTEASHLVEKIRIEIRGTYPSLKNSTLKKQALSTQPRTPGTNRSSTHL